MPSRQDPRTGNWFYRKWVKLPSGNRERIFSATDEAGQPFRRKKDSDEAERAAIEKLKHPEKRTVPTFAEWFWGSDTNAPEPAGRFWTEWVLGGRRPNSPSEQESKIGIYRKWLKEPFGALPLDRIDSEVINTFRARARALRHSNDKRRVSEKTLNNILTVLSTPLQYAVKAGVLPRAPEVGVAKVERPEIEFIEFHEVAALYAAARADARPEMYMAALLDYELGFRIGEIRELNYDTDVDMKAQRITIARQVRYVRVPSATKGEKATYRDVVGPPKGRRRRTVPMTPAVYEAMRSRVRRGFVVSAEPGKRVSKEDAQAAMKRIAARAGLSERVRGKWHLGRHTMATHAALLGIDPWNLNQWLGHATMEETMRYVNFAKAHDRPLPSTLVTAGANFPTDPVKRVLAQLSARQDIPIENLDKALLPRNKKRP